MGNQLLSARNQSRGFKPFRNWLWLGVTLLLLMSLLPINGQPLTYYDTYHYVLKGNTILDIIGGMDNT